MRIFGRKRLLTRLIPVTISSAATFDSKQHLKSWCATGINRIGNVYVCLTFRKAVSTQITEFAQPLGDFIFLRLTHPLS